MENYLQERTRENRLLHKAQAERQEFPDIYSDLLDQFKLTQPYPGW